MLKFEIGEAVEKWPDADFLSHGRHLKEGSNIFTFIYFSTPREI